MGKFFLIAFCIFILSKKRMREVFLKMKIYLLDRNKEMIKSWKMYFDRIENVEIVHDEFANFMNTHKVECVVSPANSFGLMDGGYDLAITEWFGYELMERVQRYIEENFYGEQPVATSFSIYTGYKQVKLIHTPTMREPESIKEPLVIYQCMRTTLMEAIRCNFESIVIPAFGGGCGQLNYDLIAKMMYQGFCQISVFAPVGIRWDNHLSNEELYNSFYAHERYVMDSCVKRLNRIEDSFDENIEPIFFYKAHKLLQLELKEMEGKGLPTSKNGLIIRLLGITGESDEEILEFIKKRT